MLQTMRWNLQVCEWIGIPWSEKGLVATQEFSALSTYKGNLNLVLCFVDTWKRKWRIPNTSVLDFVRIIKVHWMGYKTWSAKGHVILSCASCLQQISFPSKHQFWKYCQYKTCSYYRVSLFHIITAKLIGRFGCWQNWMHVVMWYGQC